MSTKISIILLLLAEWVEGSERYTFNCLQYIPFSNILNANQWTYKYYRYPELNIVWEPVLEMDREAHVVASQTIHKNACVDYAMGIVLLTSARAPNTRQGRGEDGHITNATPKQPGLEKGTP